MKHIVKYICCIAALGLSAGPFPLFGFENEGGYDAMSQWEIQSDSVPNQAEGRKFVSMLGFDVRPSYAFSSYLDDVLSESLSMDDAKITHFATSLNLKYAFSFTNFTENGRLFPGVWQGMGAGVNLFQHPDAIGVPVSVYLFQGAPIVYFTDRLSLDYEWNFGVSAGWKPCNGIDGRSNIIVGSRVNAYINLGVGLRWQLTDKISFTAGLDLTHFSNGNTSFPNPGVNMAGIRVGVTRTFGDKDAQIGERRITPFSHILNTDDAFSNDSNRRSPKISYDLTAYGAWRKRVYRGGETPLLLNGHFAIAGLNFAPMWDVKRYFRAGLSADLQWDKSTDQKRHYISGTTAEDIRFSRAPFFSQLSAGLSARAELVMPYFSVNVGIGYNLIGPSEARASYQLANLKIYLTRSLYLNIGYQLQDFQRQNNLMLGVGYTLFV